MLMRPAAEWRVIAAEREDVGSLYRNYIGILAAVPGVSILLGLAYAGGRYLGASAITTALMAVIVSYTIALASTIATAVVIEKLAPSFRADADMTEALKLVAYASTPVWLAGLFSMSITLAPLVVLGWLWGGYLFYVGIPLVLKTPREQVVPFMLVSALAVIVVNVVLRALVSAVSIPYY